MKTVCNDRGPLIIIIIIIIKRISRAPIYHTRWQHRVLYNNTNHTHTHTHTHTHSHTHRASNEGMGRAVKNRWVVVGVDCFCVALFCTLKQTDCTLVAFDSKLVFTVANPQVCLEF